MSDNARILFANEAFYLAFRNRDLAAMDALWAHDSEASCFHPGWRTLRGRAPIMKSWQGIFAHPGSPSVELHGATARAMGDMGLVICYEVLGSNTLCATNVFVLEQGQWRVLHHHASRCTEAGDQHPKAGPPETMQ